MQYFKITLLILLITGCTQQKQNKSQSAAQKDSVTIVKDTVSKNKNLPQINQSAEVNDSALIDLSDSILRCFKMQDFNHLLQFLHPAIKVRFSPYGIIDTARDKLLNKDELNKLYSNQNKINWGRFDATGETIYMTAKQYFNRFVYDVDFINADKKSINKIIEGTSFKNLKNIYPDYYFTEFYFPGFNPKYNGMDWKALILVFKEYDSQLYLSAIVHDEWKT